MEVFDQDEDREGLEQGLDDAERLAGRAAGRRRAASQMRRRQQVERVRRPPAARVLLVRTRVDGVRAGRRIAAAARVTTYPPARDKTAVLNGAIRKF